jgi:hypothetical protein
MGMFHAASTISLVHLAKSLLCSANSVAIELLSAFMILASTRSIPDDAQPFPTRHRQLSSKEKEMKGETNQSPISHRPRPLLLPE